ncbi:hypothetical protein LXL04_029669 [Taraxacum kok-saghyz]
MSQWPITSKQNSTAMTLPSQDSAKAELSGWDDGRGAVIRGGVSLALRCEGSGNDAENRGIPWSPSF